jgi:L-arabinose isomerase
MLDKKRKFFRLIESYIKDVHGDSVKEFYGDNTKIKVHTMNIGVKDNSILLEVVVYLGDVIREDVMDDSLAHVLIADSLVYFFPESTIRTYVRFDV